MFLINNTSFKYLNNNIFGFSLIGRINIITHAIFMKIRIVHTLRADLLYGVRITIFRDSVLGIYMTSRYMLIT